MLKGYKCEWCENFLIRKDEMEIHETNCDDNPNVKACGTCKHLHFDDSDFLEDIAGCRVKSNGFEKIRWKKHCKDWELYK